MLQTSKDDHVSYQTDHKAIVATECRVLVAQNKNLVRVRFRRQTLQQQVTLLCLLPQVDLAGVLSLGDLQEAWDKFSRLLESCWTRSTPSLNNHNLGRFHLSQPCHKIPCLMRAGQIEEASAYATRMGI